MLKVETGAVARWIKEYIHGTGRSRAVVGLSGGVDSAVVAALCKHALGADNVICVSLPCESNSDDHVDAFNVASHFGLNLITENLDAQFGEMMRGFTDASHVPEFVKHPTRIAKGNAKARLRMARLYWYAELSDGIVVGTTNLSEMMTGYATKYGDHGVDIEPLAQFYKGEVREMARFLSVPEQIITKKPSAGLWEGQTDEDELGISYEKIDTALRYIDAVTETADSAQELTRPPEDEISSVEIGYVLHLISNTEHKRELPPCYERELK